MTQFPAGSVVEKQRFTTPSPTSANLASNRHISVSVRTDHQTEISATSDVRIILDESGIRVGSLLGYLDIAYPAGYIVDLDPDQLQPWWLSRSYFFYLGSFALLWVGFSVMWRLLAGIYLFPVFILAYLWGRCSPVGTIFRLNLMALMPPALFMAAALALYGLERCNLQVLLVANVIHIPMSWLIILLSVRKLELQSRLPAVSPEEKLPQDNPFEPKESRSQDRSKRNPFSSSE